MVPLGRRPDESRGRSNSEVLHQCSVQLFIVVSLIKILFIFLHRSPRDPTKLRNRHSCYAVCSRMYPKSEIRLLLDQINRVLRMRMQRHQLCDLMNSDHIIGDELFLLLLYDFLLLESQYVIHNLIDFCWMNLDCA